MSTNKSDRAKRAADAAFSGANAMKDYQDKSVQTDKNTERLRALRLAREAELAIEAEAAKAAKKPPAKPRPGTKAALKAAAIKPKRGAGSF
ncbi:MAG: transcriptional regulator [Bauldia sp.]|jgi:hypothetical protein|nr:transcriptional regulator [Bauldia sp.]